MKRSLHNFKYCPRICLEQPTEKTKGAKTHCTRHLPLALDDSVMPMLFADDTSLIVTAKILDILDTKLIRANIQIVYNWFKSNLLSINFLKTHWSGNG
jgi:hypothetical protein